MNHNELISPSPPHTERLIITAYQLSSLCAPIVPAPVERDWMNETDQGFAKRCLPLRIANQAGWFILNTAPIEVVWDGGNSESSVRVTSPATVLWAASHFGYGILTWQIPYLFRTPPGWNLAVRGPANHFKDGISPLDGIVETDWSVATFTMNWKITRPNTIIKFDVNEPVCMIYPIRRGDLERFDGVLAGIQSSADVMKGHKAWSRSRKQFLRLDNEQHNKGWQKHYFQGNAPDGTRAAEHQTKLDLGLFRICPHDTSSSEENDTGRRTL